MDKFGNLTGGYSVRPSSGESPLMRGVDRIERALRRVTVALVLAAIPLALWMGVSTYSDQQAQSRHVAATTRTVQATTTADAPKFTTLTADYSTAPTMSVPAQWTVGGRTHDGKVDVSPGSPAGTKTDVIVDNAGNPAVRAAGNTDIVVVSVFAVVVTMVTVLSVLAAIGWAVRRRLDRTRDAMWDDALHRFFS